MSLRNWRNSSCARLAAVSLATGIGLSAPQADPVCEGSRCAVPVREGEPAPFTGQLLSTDLAIDLGMKADSCDRRLDLELEFQREKLELQIDLQKRLLEIEREGCKAQKSLLFRRLEQSEGISWYEHPAFVASITAIAVVLVFIGSGYALNAAK